MLSPKSTIWGYSIEALVDDCTAGEVFGGGSSTVRGSKLGEVDISLVLFKLLSTAVAGPGLW